jgi:hypothetical protein
MYTSNPCTVRQEHAAGQAVTSCAHPRRDAKEEDPLDHPRSVQGEASKLPRRRSNLLDVVLALALEVLALDELGDLIIVFVVLLLALTALLEALVALGKLAEGGKRVGAELVKDAGDELGELLVLTVAVDGEGVRRHSGVDCTVLAGVLDSCRKNVFGLPLGAEKWMTLPSDLNMLTSSI